MAINIMKTAIELVAIERQRQIEVEGHDIYEDKKYNNNGELADAAVCYAMNEYVDENMKDDRASYWPWKPESFKPTPNDRIRELVKAGALICAEIDRLNAKGL
jgi:hypothetical protein